MESGSAACFEPGLDWEIIMQGVDLTVWSCRKSKADTSVDTLRVQVKSILSSILTGQWLINLGQGMVVTCTSSVFTAPRI